MRSSIILKNDSGGAITGGASIFTLGGSIAGRMALSACAFPLSANTRANTAIIRVADFICYCDPAAQHPAGDARRNHLGGGFRNFRRARGLRQEPGENQNP